MKKYHTREQRIIRLRIREKWNDAACQWRISRKFLGSSSVLLVKIILRNSDFSQLGTMRNATGSNLHIRKNSPRNHKWLYSSDILAGFHPFQNFHENVLIRRKIRREKRWQHQRARTINRSRVRPKLWAKIDCSAFKNMSSSILLTDLN